MNTFGELSELKILHIGKFYPPHKGGMETHLRDLAVRQARVARVRVIVANHRPEHEISEIEGLTVERIARVTSIASMPVCPGLVNAIRKAPADIVHLHMPNPGAALAFLLSGHKGKLVITHHADTLGRKLLRQMSNPFVLRAMDRARGIIVTSARYLDSSAELAPFRRKCQIIPLGIDPLQINLEDAPDDPLSGSLPAGPILLAVGRLVKYKGFAVLLEAMRRISATLLIVGTGPEAERLRQVSVNLGVEDKVRMLGHVSDLRPYCRKADIFVMPSLTRAEAFGLVQLEAMAAGLPVINTDIDSAVPEISVDGATGFTVPPGDASALVSAINRLLNDKELRARFGAAGRARVMQEFTADTMAHRTLALYQDLLNERVHRNSNAHVHSASSSVPALDATLRRASSRS